MKYFIALATVGLLALPGHGFAKGCLKGAIVGGVAGHYAGHHTVLGAAAGCAVGHHEANKADEARRKQDNHNSGDPSHHPD
jgi:hypothetical protein